MDSRPVDQLEKLITEKLSILESLRELSQRQSALVASGDMARLITLLSVKQKTLDSLTETERRLDPFRAEDPEKRVWNSAEQREQCREMVDRCDLLLQEVMEAERQCEAELQARRENAKYRLDQSSGASAARKAYRQAGAGAARRELDLSE